MRRSPRRGLVSRFIRHICKRTANKGRYGAGSGAPRELQPIDLTVRATWDAEAAVWVAQSNDVPGLITEADDLATLMGRLGVMIPGLLEANGVLPSDVDELPVSLNALDRAHRPAA